MWVSLAISLPFAEVRLRAGVNSEASRRLFTNGPQSSGPLVDAHVPPAICVERFVPPSAPTYFEAQAGESGHQVELGRIRQSESDRVQCHTVDADAHVVLVANPSHRVVRTEGQDELGRTS